MEPNSTLDKPREERQTETAEQSSSTSGAAPRTSTLSADAPPFEFSSSQPSSTKLSVTAKEFVPRSFVPSATPAYVQPNQYTEPGAEYSVDQYAGDEIGDPLMDYAFQVLYEITCSPGQFTQLCDQLVGTLVSWPSLDETVLTILVDEIVAQAIREPNFRYNGARLCNELSRTFPGGLGGQLDFRKILFTRCKIIHAEHKSLMQSDAEYLRGFGLFMSELFVHMTTKEGTTHFRILGRAVGEELVSLLDHPTPGNLKCVVQILKLSGSYLEDNDREANKGRPVETDKLMAKIDNVARTVSMQMHIKDQLTNIIELRASDWGRAQNNAPPAREPQPVNNHSVPPPQMGVHYGPDGMALTAEEAEFLNQSLSKQEEEEEFDYQEEDTGMDDEMVEAFEKFLMMNETLK